MSLLMACRPRGPALVDTFLMARRQVFFYDLLTANSGGFFRVEDSVALFGAYPINGGNAQGNYLDLGHAVLESGETYQINVLGVKHSNRAIAHLLIGGDDTGARLNFFSTPLLRNQVVSDTFTAPNSGGTLRLLVGSRDPSCDAWILSPQQVELVQLTGTGLGTSLDDLPWYGHCLPYSYHSAEYWDGDSWEPYSPTLTQTTSAQWGSYVGFGNANQWRVKLKFWAPQGTHTLNLRHLNGTAGGTITATVNGGATTPSTFSTSAGSTTYNNSTDLTFTASFTGMQELELSASAGVACSVQWISWRKTEAIGAITPTGATYGVESMELWPWFADTKVGFDTLNIGSDYLHYGGFYNNSRALNDRLDFAHNLLPGAYSLGLINRTWSDRGIIHLSENAGASLSSADLYSAGPVSNARKTLTGALSGGTLKLTMGSKHASSTGYLAELNAIRLARTGD